MSIADGNGCTSKTVDWSMLFDMLMGEEEGVDDGDVTGGFDLF